MIKSATLDLENSSMGEAAGISSAELLSDKYWERRCHQAEAQLQELARELEYKNSCIESHKYVIASLESENKLLSAQLDIVYLIFGTK